MTRRASIMLTLVLAGCGKSAPSNEAASAPANEATSASSNALDKWPGYPKTQPDGSPLTADYCVKVGAEPGSPFDNTKTCLMVACDAGDKASCDGAATFNGNMWPDGEPPSAPTEQLTGRFEAGSTTAMGITGNLEFAPGRFEFELDQTYRVGNPQLVDASSAYSKAGDTWVDVLIIPNGAKVALWPVIDQTIGKRGRQQSLCGQGGKVGFIATADREDGLALAAFKGTRAPGSGMDDAALCGTYFYDRAKK